MIRVDKRSKNLGLPLPHAENDQMDDCARIVRSFEMLDEEQAKTRAELGGKVEAIKAEIGDKLADQLAGMTTEIADQLAGMTTEIAAKADAKTTASALAGKADLAALVTGLASKVDLEAAREFETEARAFAQRVDEVLAGNIGAIVVKTPLLSLPGKVSNAGGSTEFTATAESLLVGAAISHFLLTLPELNIEERTFPAAGGLGRLSFTVPGEMAKGTVLHVSIRAMDEFGNESETAQATCEVDDSRIAPAVISSPANGESSVSVNPAITLEPFATLYGLADEAAAVEIQIGRDAEFSDLAWNSGDLAPGQSFVCPQFLERGQTHYVRARWSGQTYGQGPWSATVAFSILAAQARAVCQTQTGVSGRALQRIGEMGQALAVSPDFSSHPVYAGISENVIDGQQMVGIPKCFVKRETLATGQFAGKDARFLSDVALPGYEVHPAFLAKDGTTALDRIWIGKYQASADGSKAASKPDAYPLANINFGTMKQRCAARNTGGVAGFHLWNIHELSLVQLLYLLEYAHTDSQSRIGYGHAANSPASVLSVSEATVAAASYRGIVGLWGNIWQFVDGLTTNSSSAIVVDMGKGAVTTSLSLAGASGCFSVNAMQAGRGSNWNCDHLFIGSRTGAGGNPNSDNQTAWPDGIELTGGGVAMAGGPYAVWNICGLFSLNLAITTSNYSVNFGGRLAKW